MRSIRIVAAVLLAAAVAATGCTAHSTAHPTAAPPTVTATPTPNQPAAPTTTLPLGHIERLDAVQAIGEGTAVAVGKGVILATSNGGPGWVRVWRGPQELRDLDFISARTGWAVGDGVLLGTVDGGQHWRRLGQPQVGRCARSTSSAPPRAGAWPAARTGPTSGRCRRRGWCRPTTAAAPGRRWRCRRRRSQCASPHPTTAGWPATGRCGRSVDGGRSWGSRPSFTLPVAANEPLLRRPAMRPPGRRLGPLRQRRPLRRPQPLCPVHQRRWRRPLARRAQHPRGGAAGTPAGRARQLPRPLLGDRPAAGVPAQPHAGRRGHRGHADQPGRRPAAAAADVPGTTLFMPHSVSFTSANRGWAVGADLAGRAVLLATSDGGRSWHSQLPS